MRYLMVSTYPPTHCGIGAYGEQSVAQLRGQGHVVDVLSPDGRGNVDFAWDLRGGSKILRILELAPCYDKIVIQYHPSFFYTDFFQPQSRRDTFRTTLSFLLLFLRCRKVEVVAHEVPNVTGRQRRWYGWKWKLAPSLVLHTQAERERLEKHYGIRPGSRRVQLREHHAVFQKFSAHTQASARQQLGLDRNRLVFLCIGFIQRHKGFHRAIQAFVQARLRDAQLYIVGSLRPDDPPGLRFNKYLAELHALASQYRNVHVLESFVSKEDFDTWITAADWTIFPYLATSSSGVLARTRLLQRPAIISAVGGLPNQAAEPDLLFTTDEELVDILQLAAMATDRLT